MARRLTPLCKCVCVFSLLRGQDWYINEPSALLGHSFENNMPSCPFHALPSRKRSSTFPYDTTLRHIKG